MSEIKYRSMTIDRSDNEAKERQRCDALDLTHYLISTMI